MRILFYLGHPAQFHFSKNAIKILMDKGHDVKILLKTKDVLEDLVKEYGLPYENIQESVRKNNKISILLASLKRTNKVYKIAKKFNADILIGTDSSVAQAAYFLKKTGITTVEDDYEVIKKLAKLTYPFTNAIVVPTACEVGGRFKSKKIPYEGYMKLGYLHPNRFNPSKEIKHNYIREKKYILIRLAKLTAHHDEGIKGLNEDLVGKTIEEAEMKGYKVYISSESELPQIFKRNQLHIKKSDIHHIMAFASLLISDSQSMSVEAAMLGVPSIRFSDFSGRISVLEELENIYGLTYGIKTDEPQKLFERLGKLLSIENLTSEFGMRKEKMLADKIDVTAFLVWFIENYPSSGEIMKKNPEYQYNFR